MGYIVNEFSKEDTEIELEVRGKRYPGKVTALPFYKKNYVK
jgi:aminomethyltransferase